MSNLHAERRRAPRKAASGTVELILSGPAGATSLPATLIEVSATGFRVSHQSAELLPGLQFEIQQGEESRQAKVVWTHVLNGERVSGCFFLA